MKKSLIALFSTVIAVLLIVTVTFTTITLINGSTISDLKSQIEELQNSTVGDKGPVGDKGETGNKGLTGDTGIKVKPEIKDLQAIREALLT